MAVLLLLPVALKAQDIVEISNGNHNQFNNALPTYTAANYSLSEQIYTAHVQRLVVFCDPQC